MSNGVPRSLRGGAKVRGEWESARQVSWWLVWSFQWLAWVLWCVPYPNSYAEALTLRTSEWDFIWTWDLVRCDWDWCKARSLGWAVIQCDLCPHKKRRLGHRYAQKYDHVRTQWEDKTGAKASGETHPADTVVSDFQPPGLWEEKFLMFMPLHLWSCYGSLSILIQESKQKPIERQQ